MAWTEITCQQCVRRPARYASDMTGRERPLVEPFLPVQRRFGRPRTTDLRKVANALLYIATTGCQWQHAAEGLYAVFKRAALFL
jgi:hypothetical protein